MALSSSVAIRAENQTNTTLGSTMNEIRTWLNREKIEPAEFKTIVGSAGLGFVISFKSEQEADRFQRQFPELIDRGRPTF
jgi:hypothetical protein